jgi:hypothetical protein
VVRYLNYAVLLGISVLSAGETLAAPVLLNDLYTPDATVFTVSSPGFLANDTSSTGGLRATSIDLTGTQGTVAAFPSGGFTFTPTQGLATNTSFSYTAVDSSGVSGTATVTLDMVSTLPKAVADIYTPNATTFTVASSAGFLTNDTGGIGGLHATSIDLTGTQGTVAAFPSGGFTFTPVHGLATNTSFTYNLADQLGRVSSATVTLDMISTLPKAINDHYKLLVGDILSIDLPGMLMNDTGGIGGLHATSIDLTGTQGTVAAFPSGGFTFTPTSGLLGETSFSYWIADALGRVSSATVFVSVEENAVPEPSSFALLMAALGLLSIHRKRTV